MAESTADHWPAVSNPRITEWPMPGNCYTEALPSRLKKYFVILFLLLTRGHFITASKSGEYPHRSLSFRQAMHGGTHFSLPANCETHLASNARVYTPVQSCWGNPPNLWTISEKSAALLRSWNITPSWKVSQGFFGSRCSGISGFSLHPSIAILRR